MTLLRAIGKAALTGLQILLKTALLLCLPAAMMFANFNIDRSGIFHGDRYNREMALALIDGQVLNDYDQIDERAVLQLLSQNIKQPYDTLALGSSRALMIPHSVVGNGSFMNCGVSGADLYDIIGIWYLFDKAGMVPENLVIVPDPQLLQTGNRNQRSNTDWYNAFLSERLGMGSGFVPEDATAAKLSALISPSYFQSNLEYYFNERGSEESPPIVTSEVENQPVNIKLGDGSVLYPLAYRNMYGTELDYKMMSDTNYFLQMYGFMEPDTEATAILDAFIGYVHGLGVKVSVVLPPYSPVTYNYATEKVIHLEGIFAAENSYRAIAAKYGIPVYGSYNPFINDFWVTDFYDGLHPKPQTVAKIFPGVSEAAKDQSAPYQWQPYGGKKVSWDTAQALVVERYGIVPPEATARGEDTVVEGEASWLVQRWSRTPPDDPDEIEDLPADEKPVLLASYAVTKKEGIIYRFDTDLEMWTVDLRFPN